MLNIVELEKKWLRYKIKSFIPHIAIGISLLIIIVLLFNFLSADKEPVPSLKLQPEEKKVTPKEQNSTKKEKVVKKAVIIKKPTPPKVIVKEIIPEKQEPKPQEKIKEKVKLKPSLDFMKKMQNSVHMYYNNDMSEESVPPQEQIVYNKPKSTPVKEKTIIRQKIEPEIKKVTIKRQNTQNDINQIIKRFQKNNNPALSLFVAKKYYELGNYEQSYNYALITNQINSNIEASWLIFARSLVKLHKKDKAIHTLQEYIKVSHSSNAEILLNEITSGKFK